MRAYLGIDIDYCNVDLDFPDLNKVKSQHITLYFWDNLSQNDAENISRRLKDYRYNALMLEATQIFAFPNSANPQLIALSFNSDVELIRLRENVLNYLGITFNEKFESHITLYRKQKLDATFKNSKEYLRNVAPIKISISNIALYKSEPEKGLNEYSLLEKIFLS